MRIKYFNINPFLILIIVFFTAIIYFKHLNQPKPLDVSEFKTQNVEMVEGICLVSFVNSDIDILDSELGYIAKVSNDLNYILNSFGTELSLEDEMLNAEKYYKGLYEYKKQNKELFALNTSLEESKEYLYSVHYNYLKNMYIQKSDLDDANFYVDDFCDYYNLDCNVYKQPLINEILIDITVIKSNLTLKGYDFELVNSLSMDSNIEVYLLKTMRRVN